MYYFPKHRIGYFHIPKTGGTSVSEWLREFLEGRGDRAEEIQRDDWHEPMSVKRELLGAERFARTRLLSNVRNPYATAVSYYFWCRKKFDEKHSDWDRTPGVAEVAQMPFGRFVAWYQDHEKPFDDYLLVDGALPPNLRLLRLESIEADTERVVKGELGLDIGKPVPRLTHSKHGPFLSYLSADDIDRLNRMQAWAFTHLYADARLDPGSAQRAEQAAG
jgi:hypothetical protein